MKLVRHIFQDDLYEEGGASNTVFISWKYFNLTNLAYFNEFLLDIFKYKTQYEALHTVYRCSKKCDSFQ